MRQAKPKQQYLIILTVVFISIICGLSFPNLFGDKTLHFNFEPGPVVASTRDQYTFGSPLIADAFSGTILEKGRLVHVLPVDKEYSGSKIQAVLEQGKAHLALEHADIDIGTFKAVSKNSASPNANNELTSTIFTALKKLNFVELKINDSDIAIALPGGIKERLSNANLIVKRKDKVSVSATGTAVWRGQNVKIELQTGPLQKSLSRMPLTFSMQGKYISISFAGSLIKRTQYILDGDVLVNLQKSWKLAQALNIIWPSLATMKTFSLAGPMTWSQNVIAFERAIVKLDENHASGALTIKTIDKRPLLSGTLAFDKLNLTAITTSKSDNSIAQYDYWKSIVSDLWSTPITKLLDADLRLSAKHVLIGSTKLRKVAATLSLNNSKLSARLANLNYEDGSGNGQLTIDFNNISPHMTVRGKLNSVPAGYIFNTVFGQNLVEGNVNITVDLETRGTRLKPALENATGHIHINQAETSTIGFDLAAVMNATDVNSAVESIDKNNHITLDVFKGTTQIDELIALVKVKNGAQDYTNFQARFGSHIVKGIGNFDLLSKLIDMRLLFHKQELASDKSASIKTQKLSIESKNKRALFLNGSLLNPSLKVTAIETMPRIIK